MKKLNIIACLLLCPVLMLTACTPGVQQPTQQPTQQSTQQPTTAPTPTEHIINTDVTYDYTFAKQYTPFWLDDVMYNECVCFVQGTDGNISATLGFKPLKIVSVRDWTLKKELVEGVDYVYDEATNTFTRPEGSSVPYFTQNWLHGKNEDGTLIPQFVDYNQPPWSTLGKARWGNAMYCLTEELYGKQMFVTYVYNSDTVKDAAVAKYQGDKLPKTIAKLKNGEEVRILFYGDSIPYGCDASKQYNRDPKQDPFPIIVRKGLQELYNVRIKYTNSAVGGTTSGWCVENIQNDVIRHEPDLVFLLTGGNDGNMGIAYTKNNVKKFVTELKKTLPDCEVLLMDSFLGSADAGWDLPDHRPYMKGAYDDIASQFEGVISVGICELHQYLIARKNYIDFSSNGINHPNDYMIRIYAQQLVATLYDFEGNR